VLILGDHRQSLRANRSLARGGIRVIFGSPARDGGHPPIDAGEEFGVAVANFLRSRGDVAYLLPVGERELLADIGRRLLRVGHPATARRPGGEGSSPHELDRPAAAAPRPSASADTGRRRVGPQAEDAAQPPAGTTACPSAPCATQARNEPI
jgi:hypothetical protein